MRIQRRKDNLAKLEALDLFADGQEYTASQMCEIMDLTYSPCRELMRAAVELGLCAVRKETIVRSPTLIYSAAPVEPQPDYNPLITRPWGRATKPLNGEPPVHGGYC